MIFNVNTKELEDDCDLGADSKGKVNVGLYRAYVWFTKLRVTFFFVCFLERHKSLKTSQPNIYVYYMEEHAFH